MPKYLARYDSKNVAIIGTGKQGRAQLTGLNEIFKIRQVRAWSPTKDHREAYAKEMSNKLGILVEPVATAKQAVTDSDVVVTATWAREPLIEDGWIKPGTHINAIAAARPGVHELPPKLLKRAKIFADDVEQALRLGAVNVGVAKGLLTQEDIRESLGQVVTGKIPGRTSDNEITIFDSSGLGMTDIALASIVHKKALEKHPKIIQFTQ